MSRVSTIDATGARILDDVIARLRRRGIEVLLSGIHPSHEQVLTALGVAADLYHQKLVFADTPAAITHAQRLLDVTPLAVDTATSDLPTAH